LRPTDLANSTTELRQPWNSEKTTCEARQTSHVTCHMSHVTRHTSHVTRHTSHTSHIHITHHKSHITHNTSHITCHTYNFVVSGSKTEKFSPEIDQLWGGIVIDALRRHGGRSGWLDFRCSFKTNEKLQNKPRNLIPSGCAAAAPESTFTADGTWACHPISLIKFLEVVRVRQIGQMSSCESKTPVTHSAQNQWPHDVINGSFITSMHTVHSWGSLSSLFERYSQRSPDATFEGECIQASSVTRHPKPKTLNPKH